MSKPRGSNRNKISELFKLVMDKKDKTMPKSKDRPINFHVSASDAEYLVYSIDGFCMLHLCALINGTNVL